jgi:hypothetical protein
MPVGGPRHYPGAGLGNESGWACPSCGAENAGPIAQGCALCGAGRPGRHIGTDAPPPPPPATPRPTPEPPAAPARPTPAPGAERWLDHHPEATLEEAFTAGYIEGVRDARRAQLAAAPPQQPIVFSPELVINRTLVAALTFFRDQVLAGNPDEVTDGEWLSAQQVTALIRQIEGEVVHG